MYYFHQCEYISYIVIQMRFLTARYFYSWGKR